jgi:RNA polymerase sigma-70 factor (ECF subfamily)
LNRTYALSKVVGKEKAIIEALKLDLKENHFYHSLLGNLNTDMDNKKAIFHFEMAHQLAKSNTDKMTIENHLKKLK